MKQFRIWDVFMIPLCSLGLHGYGYGQTVEWMNPSVQGNGCSAADTTVVFYGDEISYVFSSLGIRLGAAGNPKAANKFCMVAADARVDPGIYVAQFQQVLTYGIAKSQWGSQAALMTSGQFYGHHIKPFRITFRNGTHYNDAISSETLSDDETSLSKRSWWCKPNRNPRGHLKARIDVSGQLLGPDEGTVALSAQTFDVKYSASIQWLLCS